VISKFQINYR